MNLLDYEKLKVHTEKKNGRTVSVIIYEKKEEEYRILNKNFSDSQTTFLKKNKASGKTNTTFINFEDDDSITVYASMGDLSTDLLQVKENASTTGASVLRNLMYLDEHLNIYIEVTEYQREFVSGLVLAYYKYNFLNKDKKNINTISVLGSEEVNTYTAIYNGQNFVRFLGDTPSNLMTPTLFVEYAKKYCTDLKVEVFDKGFMEKKNMNLLLGVAQGSRQDPKLIKISYKGKSTKEVDLSLVGKGITFDTGGISLKPSANMAAMKGDMMGAATVLATIKLASDMRLNINIEAVLPLTENMPGGVATKPGDVHIGMSGISVEIDNTDAEGRLILGDAISYAQESNPKYLLDIATLTGAISVALGDNFIGYFSNDDKLAGLIYEASIESSDPAWRMPLSSLYLSSMKSNVADLKNAGGRKGGSCTAAIFLNEFVNKDIKWTHFDIAGVDWDHRNKMLYGSGMTGKGLPLLYEVVKNLSEEK
ncbi:hypothetical protein P3W45_000957 [Vairimorpha bombi]|jgi:cytosol aminopeptidase